MIAPPPDFESVIDRECVICSKRIPDDYPGRLTCSRECGRTLSKIRRKQYRQRVRGDRYTAPPEIPGLALDRKCLDCGLPLSIYNRGRYCNPCWSSLSRKQREKRGGRG